MKRFALILALFALLAMAIPLTGAAPTSAPVGAATQGQIAYHATGFLQIRCEPEVLVLTNGTVNYLLGFAVGPKAWKQCFSGQPPNYQLMFYGEGTSAPGGSGSASGAPAPNAVAGSGAGSVAPTSFSPGEGGLNSIAGYLTISTTDAPTAEKLLNAILENLHSAFNQLHDVETVRLKERLMRLMDTQALARKQLEELQAERSVMRKNSGCNDLSREFVLDLNRTVEKERQEVSLKTDRLQVRKEAIEKLIARIATESKETKKSETPVVLAYRERLAAMDRKVGHLRQQVEAGATAPGGLDDAEIALAMAKAELESKIQEVGDSYGGRRLFALNEELSAISLDMIEAQSRAATLRAKSAEMNKLIDLSDRYELGLGIEMLRAKAAYETASQRAADLRIRVENASMTPVITLLRE